ncbi:MAG: hypothetical protein ACFE9V_20065 [Candidatus Hodarchaeota archaeon]
MKNQNKILSKINFENNKNTTQFFRLIKNEYLKSLYQTYLWLIILVVIYVVYQLFITPFNQSFPLFISDQIIIWIFFSLYLLIHFFALSYIRFSPTIIEFIEKELHTLGFKFRTKYKFRTPNCLFNCISLIILIFATRGIYYSSSKFMITFILRLVIIYSFAGISIPILRGKLHDIFQVNLRDSYFIQIEFQLKLIKHKEVESQMVRIYMISSKLCPKADQTKILLYNKISENRWLQKKDHRILIGPIPKNYLYFREYATIVNFKEHFLNLVSAIREWDISHDNPNFKINC